LNKAGFDVSEQVHHFAHHRVGHLRLPVAQPARQVIRGHVQELAQLRLAAQCRSGLPQRVALKRGRHDAHVGEMQDCVKPLGYDFGVAGQ
jgi:hypothetical protein